MSLPLRHGCCMPGAVRGWILPPRDRGPFRLSPCHICIACHGEAASPVRAVLCMPQSQEVSYICRLMLLQLASLADM